MMKHLILVAMLAACGGKQTPAGSGAGSGSGSEPPSGLTDTRTALEKRRDTACEQLAPKMTACAVEDAKADLAAGKVTQKQFDQDTASGVLKKNSEEFMKKCQVEMSSRQVRVLEVCPHEETQCGPLLACLENLNKH
ncbi:MAG: hypothetical protein JWO36_6963 [Myxococcales bacterium]|nr:hypothetical protein [Myxococcales bacterium]